MAKPEQVLIIEPQNELRFRGPFTNAPVTSYIKLMNPTSDKVYFKIKTTAPKRYCVRPNSGFLKPNGSTEIAVCLQPYDFDPAEKNKHKFMVQTVIAPENDEGYPSDVWRDINPSQLMDSKLKCVFENPVVSTTTAKTTSTISSTKTTSSTSVTKSDSNTTNGKNKGTCDSVKSSPKVLGEAEEKLLKAAQEVNQLRVEESTLRQENLQLKEDLLKLKNATLRNDTSVSAAGDLMLASPGTSTSTCVIVAIIMVIMGYLLGKMI